MSDAATIDRIDEWYRGGMILVLVELARRSGVLPAFCTGRWQAGELAAAAGVHERYLVEWLCAMASYGVATYDRDEDGTERWSLAERFRDAFDPSSSTNRLVDASELVGAAHQMVKLVEPFTAGGGLSYAERDRNLADAFDTGARASYTADLLRAIVPSVPGLTERLCAGVRYADLGCGSGYVLELLARAYPGCAFVGLDPASHLVERARRRVAGLGIANVTFDDSSIETMDHGTFDVVSAFQVVHNLPDPVDALRRALRVLVPGGFFFMYENAGYADRSRNLALPWAGSIYACSLLSCLTVSLAEDGAGCGAMWGVERAEQAMGEAGFVGVGSGPVADDPTHMVVWGFAPVA